MKYTLFGRSGLRVSELCLGTLTFGDISSILRKKSDDYSNRQESFSILEYFSKAGGNFIDTSNIYGGGYSESIIGEFIKSDRDHFVIGTKYSMSIESDPFKTGNGRKSMMISVERSLKNLGTDYLDIFWLHVWDQITPIDEILRGFDDLVSSGKILHAGVSNLPAWKISQANTLADLRGWSPFIGVQICYNLTRRDAERELLPMAKELNLGITAFGVMAQGLLSKGRGSDRKPERLLTEKDRKISKILHDIAQDAGISPSQLALANIRQKTTFGRIIPIIGARTLDQLVENMNCLDVVLSDEHMKIIDEATAIDLGHPHTDYSSDGIRRLLNVGQYVER